MDVRYSLIITPPDGLRRELEVEDLPVTVGRLPKSTIQVEESPVSRQHCVVIPTGAGLTILDQGSTNGTFVNGSKRQHARLQHGDEIRVGKTTILVEAVTHASKEQTTLPLTPDPEASCPMLADQQVSFLVKLGETLAKCPEVSAVIQAILKTVLDTFPVQRCLMLARHSSSDQIRVIASKSQPNLNLPEDLYHRELVKRVIERAKAESIVARSDEESNTQIRWDSSGLCSPIWKGDQVVGAIYADSESPPTWFDSPELLNLFSGVVNVASLAIAKGQSLRFSTDDENSAIALVRPGEGAETSIDPAIEKIKLAERLSHMEHLEQARGALSRGLVHDIKNLVNALNSNHTFIRSTLTEGSDEMEAMDDASAITKRLVAMSEDVLSLSRMEEGSFPLATQVVDVLQMLTRAHRRHSGAARENGVSLAMGPVDEGLTAFIDPNVVDRMLDNLVNNAIRHAGDEGWVVLTAAGQSHRAELTVSDSGPGIPAEERERVFGEFYCNEDSGSRHHGIGLYFCAVAAKAHGGEIRIEGGPGDNRLVISVPAATETGDLSTTEILSSPQRKNSVT